MNDHGPFPENPEDTRTAIMEATFQALCEHGYANLTIQRIGEKFPKSTSLLYHHYEGKDDLLLDFLDHMLERFEERELSTVSQTDPEVRLCSYLNHAVPSDGQPSNADFLKALVELRAQAAHNEAYRQHFTRTQERFHEYLAGVVSDGVADGTFRDVNPKEVASFLVTVASGSMFSWATTNAETAEGARAELDRYIEKLILSDE